MDQNNTNQLPTTPAEQPVTPVVPAHEPITTVQQPSDAPAMPLAVEGTPAPAAPAVPVTPTEAPAMASAPAAVPASAHDSPIVTEVHTATGGQPHKKPVMMLVGIFIIVMLVAGGAIYVMGLSNNTKRLGATIQKPVQTVVAQPTEVPLPEETELNTIDTSKMDADLQSLDTDVTSLQ